MSLLSRLKAYRARRAHEAALARDLKTIATCPATVLFISFGWIDEVWVRSTLLECHRRGMKVALLILGVNARKGADEAVIADYQAAGVPVIFTDFNETLQNAPQEIIVTATSGLTATYFSPNAKFRVHIPHSLASLHYIYPAHAFDHYNVLCAVGPHHLQEIAIIDRLRGIQGRQVFPTGYGRLDVLYQRGREYAQQARANTQAEPYHVLIAPSWSDENVMKMIGLDLTAALLEQGYQVTLRPHPLQFSSHAELLAQFTERFGGSGRFTLEDSNFTDRSIYTADLLVADYSGFSMEFHAIRPRPIVFAETPVKKNNPQAEMIGLEPMERAIRSEIGTLVPVETAAVLRQIATFRASTTPIPDQRSKFTFNPDGVGEHAASVIAQLGREV